MTSENIQTNFSKLTILPVREISKSDSIGGALLVVTPHKGEVVIDYQKETGFFIKSLVGKRATDVIKILRDLEWEAKEYLLGQWLHPNNPQS